MTTGPSFTPAGTQRSRRVGGRRVRRPPWRARPGDPGGAHGPSGRPHPGSLESSTTPGTSRTPAARCGSPDRYASSWTARPRRGRPSGAAPADPWGRHGALRAPDGRDRTLTRRRPCARPAHPRDSRRALPRTRRRTGASARPAATGPGAAVAAATAACVKASTFSCHIRVYSRRSRALGGHPPVSVRAVRYPITSGAVQAISHLRGYAVA